jgi:hypothetical protein
MHLNLPRLLILRAHLLEMIILGGGTAAGLFMCISMNGSLLYWLAPLCWWAELLGSYQR